MLTEIRDLLEYLLVFSMYKPLVLGSEHAWQASKYMMEAKCDLTGSDWFLTVRGCRKRWSWPAQS